MPASRASRVIAPPRSGKGAAIVIPNLLRLAGLAHLRRHQARELARSPRAIARACGQACYLFDPFSETRNTARWNPLGYVPDDPTLRINDLQRIARHALSGTPGRRSVLDGVGAVAVLGIALYVFETPSLPQDDRRGAAPGHGVAMMKASARTGSASSKAATADSYPLSPECVRALYDVIDLAPVTASSIRKTFTSRLDLWLNPILDAATSGNDFDLRELRSKRRCQHLRRRPARRPASPAAGADPVLPAGDRPADARSCPSTTRSSSYQVMMLLDEFTALGRIPIIAEAIGLLRGYNMRVVLVIQARSQLREVYGTTPPRRC